MPWICCWWMCANSTFVTAHKRRLGQGNIFKPVCHSVPQGGGGVCADWGGSAWLLLGGTCVVAPRGRGMCGCPQGECVVAPGGHAQFLPGGHEWLLLGSGMCGIWRDTEIGSMSGRYVSYWNAFLFLTISANFAKKIIVRFVETLYITNNCVFCKGLFWQIW